MSSFFTSSIGKKVLMAALGLFLIVFLLVHLGINSLLIFSADKEFNIAAHFMGTNIIIKMFEVVLFAALLLHAVYGVILQIQNWIARPVRYKIDNYSQTSFFSKFMIHTAVIILVFLIIHLSDFYFKAKVFGNVATVTYDGKPYHDLASLVLTKFKIPGYIIFNIACFLLLGFHLLHGFQSSFQTLGLNGKSFTPVIKAIGTIYTVVIVAGFITIPIVIYFIR